MESTTLLRSFQYAVSTSSSVMSVLEKPGMVSIKSSSFSSLSKLPMFGGKIISSTNKHGSVFIPCSRTSESTVAVKSNSNGSAVSDSQSQGLTEKKSAFSATFPNGFEALLTEVCDETKIAELKVKFGAFEINMKRNIDGPTIYAPPPQTSAPAVTSKPADPTPASPPPKPSAEKTSAFTNVSVEKASKLAALEASGSTGYVIVSSPTVGSFRRGRTLKGKKQPPACKEGDVIKEGQVIGFVDQFATELPIRSDVAGEVLKLLFSDGEAVGYGDPLIAVLPSFHGIK